MQPSMSDFIKGWTHWKTECARVLNGNVPNMKVLEQLQFRYTCPAREKGTYLPQWLWDSCFHAMAYRWFDGDMAWDELQSLFVHQVTEGDDAGMVPHMAYFAENDDVVDQTLFRHLHRSMLTQPPLIAIAAQAVYERHPDKDRLAYLFPRLLNYHEWFDRRRDPDKDYLVAIIHPWESGWDASQRWDTSMGIANASSQELRELGEKRKRLVGVIIKHACNARKIAEDKEGFYVEPVDFNAIRAADIKALASIAQELGEHQQQQELEDRAQKIRDAIQRKMIDTLENSFLVSDLVGGDETRSSVSKSAAKFILLFGKCATPEQATQLHDELTGTDAGFISSYRVTTTATTHRLFVDDEYWRGNIWLPVNWLIWKGLERYGFTETAKHIAEESLRLVQEHGFCEFFSPITGQRGKSLGSYCPEYQSWSTIVLDMLASYKVSS